VRGKGGKHSLHIVEIKYCRDTDREKQEQRAEQQHQRLASILEHAGHKVKKHTVLLGVGGTVYKDTLQTLVELGMDRNTAKQALEAVHIYSVQQVHKVLKIRRFKEAEVRKQQGLQAVPRLAWGRRGKPSKRWGKTQHKRNAQSRPEARHGSGRQGNKRKQVDRDDTTRQQGGTGGARRAGAAAGAEPRAAGANAVHGTRRPRQTTRAAQPLNGSTNHRKRKLTEAG
jgi:hypothetical protein